MRPRPLALMGIAILAGLIGTMAWQRHQKAALSARLAAAEDRLRQRDQTLLQNERLARAVAELSAINRLHEERRAYDARWAPEAPEPVAAGYIARSDLANKGNATPKDACETYWWALEHLDTKTLATLFYFRPEARKGMDAYFASLPEEVRGQYADATELFATLYAAEHAINFTGAQVTRTEMADNAPYSAKLDTSFEYDGGQTRDHVGEMVFVNPEFKTKAEWRLYGTLGQFRYLVKHLSTSPKG